MYFILFTYYINEYKSKCSKLLKISEVLAGVAQLVRASSCKPEGRGFNSQLGYILRLWIWSWLRHVQEATDPCSSLTSSPSLPLFLKSVIMSFGED